ncbi:SspB family protein [Aureimonas endophytica]|nr:SspB family protein [Aureimonas endophytica]
MSQDLIRYDILAQEALRGVIRKVLGEVVKTGLPGDHHFFITFLTSAPGVRVSSRLREKYPELMTIVIQHQYWDLAVTETSFEVGLSFSDIPERLLVPFAAIRGFYDPAVNFELEFDVRDAEAANSPGSEAGAAPLALAPVPLAAEDKPKRSAAPAKLATKAADISAEDEAADAPAGEPKKAADVVSLDAFRKKT